MVDFPELGKHLPSDSSVLIFASTAILIFPSRFFAFWAGIHVGVRLPKQHIIILAHMDLVVSKAQFTKILICIMLKVIWSHGMLRTAASILH